jgi:prepilin-type processing-associated H-X9-DG protein
VPFDGDLTVPQLGIPDTSWQFQAADLPYQVFTEGNNGGTTILKTREGIERFLITDINNPAGSAQAQSTVPVMFDTFGRGTEGASRTGIETFNHLPGGANILYMDGHVAFQRYSPPPGEEWPITAYLAAKGLGGAQQ